MINKRVKTRKEKLKDAEYHREYYKKNRIKILLQKKINYELKKINYEQSS